MMKDLGLITKLPRIVVAQAERANPLYRSYLKNFESFEPITAEKTLASAIQIGNPVSIQKAIRTLKQFNGIVEQVRRVRRRRRWRRRRRRRVDERERIHRDRADVEDRQRDADRRRVGRQRRRRVRRLPVRRRRCYRYRSFYGRRMLCLT